MWLLIYDYLCVIVYCCDYVFVILDCCEYNIHCCDCSFVTYDYLFVIIYCCEYLFVILYYCDYLLVWWCIVPLDHICRITEFRLPNFLWFYHIILYYVYVVYEYVYSVCVKYVCTLCLCVYVYLGVYHGYLPLDTIPSISDRFSLKPCLSRSSILAWILSETGSPRKSMRIIPEFNSNVMIYIYYITIIYLP